jgi:hypothetical protein
MRSAWPIRVALVVALGLAPSCQRVRATFQCTLDTACVNGATKGRCEPSGYCSFSDSSCASGFRYGVAAGSLSKQCATPTERAGTIIPLYEYPMGNSWAPVINAKKAHPTVPIIVVVNPSSGPGSTVDSNYTGVVEAITDAGCISVGYVLTDRSTRAMSDAQADIVAYHSFYPRIDGIFFDQMAYTAGGEGYYSALTAFAKGMGFTLTIGNPGTDTLPSYFGTVDILTIYEGAGVPSVSSLGGWHAAHPASSFGLFAYSVPSLDGTFVSQAKRQIGYIYLTDDTDAQGNPWSAPPSYLDALLSALEP